MLVKSFEDLNIFSQILENTCYLFEIYAFHLLKFWKVLQYRKTLFNNNNTTTDKLKFVTLLEEQILLHIDIFVQNSSKIKYLKKFFFLVLWKLKISVYKK